MAIIDIQESEQLQPTTFVCNTSSPDLPDWMPTSRSRQKIASLKLFSQPNRKPTRQEREVAQRDRLERLKWRLQKREASHAPREDEQPRYTLDEFMEVIRDWKVENLREHDPGHKARWMLDKISTEGEIKEYCGLPMQLVGKRLIIEPSHPAYEIYKEESDKYEAEHETPEERELEANTQMVNQWHCRRHGFNVFVWREYGKLKWGRTPAVHNLERDLETVSCSVAWSIEAEAKAQEMLGELIDHGRFRQYLLTGMFLETSKRSGVVYVFRKLRPTIAIRADDKGSKILAAMCMHPIGYYENTWAGSMVPTDDVAAHLLLMRSDEHMFWKRCNQHAPWRREAGL